MADPTIAEIDGGPLPLKPSLFHYLTTSLTSRPNNKAIIVAHQHRNHLREFTNDTPNSNSTSTLNHSNSNKHDHDSLQWSYAQTHAASLKLAAGLQHLGISTGSTVVTIMPSCVESLLFLWTSILAKFTLAPLDPGVIAGSRSAELRGLLTRIRPNAVVVAGQDDEVAVDAALRDLALEDVVRITLSSTDPKTENENGNGDGTGWHPFTHLATQTPTSTSTSTFTTQIESAALNDDPNRTQMILFTSGTTTGIPKGCPRSVRNAMHNIAAHVWGQSNDERAVNLLHTPNFRIVYPALATSTWHHGGCVVIPGPTLTLSGMIDAVYKHGVTMMLLLPTTSHVLLGYPEFAKVDRSRIRTVIVGADMVTEDAYRSTCLAFPHSEVFNGHGATEGASAFEWPFMGRTGIQDVPFHAGITPLGHVKQGTRLKIADDENQAVKRGEIGELQFCSDAIITHYLDNAKPEDFYEDEKGRRWFKSGDTGLIDEAGWVYILGRKQHIFKRRGIKIVPAALESCIDGFVPTQSCVLGIPDEALGCSIVAVVRGLNGKSREEIMGRVVGLFGETNTMRAVVTLEELGLREFPLTGTGKILKRELEGPVERYLKDNGEGEGGGR